MNDFPQVYEKSRLDEMYARLAMPKENIDLLHDYFSAFAEFYNIISLREAFGIVKRHNGDLISEDDFTAFSEIVRHDDGYYYYILSADELYEDVAESETMDREIVLESMVDIDFDVYYDTSKAQKGKPLYIPEKDKLLKYADDRYYEHTPQTKALLDFLCNKIGMSSGQSEDFVGECDLCIRYSIIPKEHPIDAIVNDYFIEKIISKRFTKLQYAEFLKLVCDMVNNTRLPCNRGFTPNELADRVGIGERQTVAGISSVNSGRSFDSSEIGLVEIVHNSTITGEKVGRNDPCPCGSGKKYKKCCGR